MGIKMKLNCFKISSVKIFTFLILLFFISPSIIGQNQIQYEKNEKNSFLQVNNLENYDLLIITADDYINELDELVNHKENYGVKTKLVSLSRVFEEMFWNGRDQPEKIKYFIKEAYDFWNIKYVMFVGDFRKMPVRYVHNQDVLQGFYEPKFISDLYFADIYDEQGQFSSWDSDNDGVYGEWIDDGVSQGAEDKNINLYPDVYVGRLACRTKVEVKTMVDKIINYESTTSGSEWFNRIMVCAGDTYPESENPEWVGNEGERNTQRVLENMSGFEHIKLWTSDGSFTGVRNIIDEFHNGCGFVYFDGHANPFSWSTHPPNDADTWIDGLTVITMSFLRNKQMLPVVVVGGCHNNQFDVHLGKLTEDPFYYYTWIPECWGWKLTRKIGGGSIATIGCSGLGMTSEDKFEGEGGAGDFLEPSFFYEYGVNGTDILGETWGKAISRYLNEYPINWDTSAAWNDAIDTKTVQQWILLGDPSLKIGGY
jgi:hypothetical protein